MEITKKYSFDDINKLAFRQLIETGFGKALDKNYFDYCSPDSIILAEEKDKYPGAVVVESITSDIKYLDKIVVSPEYQGNGLGGLLWDMLEDKLVWRAMQGNPIRKFYEKQCDGMQFWNPWTVYWSGLDINEIPMGIDYALAKKPTLYRQ